MAFNCRIAALVRIDLQSRIRVTLTSWFLWLTNCEEKLLHSLRVNLYKKQILCLHSFCYSNRILHYSLDCFSSYWDTRVGKIVRGEITKVKCCSNVIIMTESFRKGDEKGEYREMTEREMTEKENLEVRRRYQKDHHPSFSAPTVVGSRPSVPCSSISFQAGTCSYMFPFFAISLASLLLFSGINSHYCFLWTAISLTFIIDVRERRRKKPPSLTHRMKSLDFLVFFLKQHGYE